MCQLSKYWNSKSKVTPILSCLHWKHTRAIWIMGKKRVNNILYRFLNKKKKVTFVVTVKSMMKMRHSHHSAKALTPHATSFFSSRSTQKMRVSLKLSQTTINSRKNELLSKEFWKFEFWNETNFEKFRVVETSGMLHFFCETYSCRWTRAIGNFKIPSPRSPNRKKTKIIRMLRC